MILLPTASAVGSISIFSFFDQRTVKETFVENRETYTLGNLVSDFGDDVKKLRSLYKSIRFWLDKTRIISLVLSYISILLFAFYGFYHGNTTGAWTLSYIIFGVCAAMLIANTVLLCLETRHRQAEDVRRGVAHVFHWITAILKLAMTVVIVCGLVTLGDTSSLPMRVVFCLLSVLWMGVTLTVDVLMLVFTLFFRYVKDLLNERKDRCVTAFVNTAVDMAVRNHPIAQGAVLAARLVAPKFRERVAAWRDKHKQKKALAAGKTKNKQETSAVLEDKPKRQKRVAAPKDDASQLPEAKEPVTKE